MGLLFAGDPPSPEREIKYIKHRMERDKFDTYEETLAFLDKFLKPILANNWYLRAADLGHEVDYDTKKGQWYVHIRWAEIDRDIFKVEYSGVNVRFVGEV